MTHHSTAHTAEWMHGGHDFRTGAASLHHAPYSDEAKWAAREAGILELRNSRRPGLRPQGSLLPGSPHETAGPGLLDSNRHTGITDAAF